MFRGSGAFHTGHRIVPASAKLAGAFPSPTIAAMHLRIADG